MIRPPPISTLFPYPTLFRFYIRPAAQKVGIRKQFGWHTFRHTYSTLLRSAGTEFKVMQELLRHSSFITLNSVPTLRRDRKSTRLNSSHQIISYAVFCLKKKK